MTIIEKTFDDRKQHSSPAVQVVALPKQQHHQPQQQQHIPVQAPPHKVQPNHVFQQQQTAPVNVGKATKSQRKRDLRSRSQEWPDVPDIGKIEENNPEILAQKILETGRQIEAGKLLKNKELEKKTLLSVATCGPDSVLMPAPSAIKAQNQRAGSQQPSPQQQLQQQLPQQVAVPKNTNSPNNSSSSGVPKMQESPKVVNFEDRLKSIITSVLNEDQEQRKQQQVVVNFPAQTVSPDKNPKQQQQIPQQVQQQQPPPVHQQAQPQQYQMYQSKMPTTTSVAQAFASQAGNHNQQQHHQHQNSIIVNPINSPHSPYKATSAISNSSAAKIMKTSPSLPPNPMGFKQSVAPSGQHQQQQQHGLPTMYQHSMDFGEKLRADSKMLRGDSMR